MMKNNRLNLFSILSFLVSILGHFIVLSVFILASKFLNASSSKIKFNYVEKSVRVDMVSMPKFTLKELEAVSLKKTEKLSNKIEPDTSSLGNDLIKESVKKDDISLIKIKKKVSFSDLLKKIQSKNIHKKSKSKAQNKIAQKHLGHRGKIKKFNIINKLIYAGNKIQKGTSLNEGNIGVNASQLNNYAAILPTRIREHWSIPNYLVKSNIRCRIRIFIGEKGQLLKYSFVEKSGNKEFDSRAVIAIKNVGYFPVPRSEILENVRAGEIVLGFPL